MLFRSVEGMGHDLPRAAWPQLIDAIATHALRGSEHNAPASALNGSAAAVNGHSNGSHSNGNLSLPARPPSRAGS